MLFLDDLQWLDTETFGLLEHLITEPEVKNLLLIGAYRDNEVSPSHPLMRTLEAIREADIINLLRIQHERQRKEYFPGIGEYTTLFGLTKKRAKSLKPDCLVMHPGPINRGVEIDSEVADGLQSVILDQVTNGLAVRMAVLYLCGGIAT